MSEQPRRLHPVDQASRGEEFIEPDQPAAAEGRVASRLLTAIVESSNDAILSKDLNGIITSWNAGAERMYGYTAEEAIGKPVSILVPPEQEDDIPSILARLRRGERVRHYETLRMARDGRRLTVSLTVSPLRDERGRVVGGSAIARDISDRVEEATRWRLLSEVGQRLAEALDRDQILHDLAQLLVPQLADYCITYALEGEVIRRVGAVHAEPHGEQLVRRLVKLQPPSVHDRYGAGAVIRTGQPILVADISPQLLEEASGGGQYYEVLRELEPVSTMVIPLRARGRMVGALALVSTVRTGRRYDNADLVLGREVAERAALAIDNALLYGAVRDELRRREAVEESLRRRFEQLRVLYELTAAVSRTANVDEIFEQAMDGLRDGLGVQRAAILLLDDDNVMRFRAWRGLSEGYREAAEGHSPWPSDARYPAVITVPDVETSEDLAAEIREAARREGIRGLAFIPLVVDGTLVGKFMLYFDTPRELQSDELELARAVASTVAFGIARATDERNVRDAKESAERASAAKSQFLGVMSHELRTPLNAVVGYAELLLLETKGPLNTEQRQQLERILISARHQLELVEELLTYTRLEAGREEPKWLETDVRRIVNDVMELIRPEAERKGLTLQAELDPASPTLITDPAKLRQIALNLAGNAVKYTEEGSVEIRVRYAPGRLLLEVADTGVGIPEDRLEYIFQPFSRVDESHTRVTMGTGLGLAIARRLAELLGAEVQVRSRLGVGSTFRIVMPLLPEPNEDSAPSNRVRESA